MHKNRAFFLDRDGVIIKNIPYLNNINELEFLPGVKDAIRLINKSGYKCIVITNQSGVARGLISLNEIESLHKYINKSLREYGAVIDAFYFCPHHPSARITKYAIDCDCRKPRAGLFYEASRDHKVDLSNSIMVGDKSIDIAAGLKAGCECFQINNRVVIGGNKTAYMSLGQVVNYVLSRQQRSKDGNV
jgi:D-glycero-D-manno-heptose 1,7-bisphosphate phosphatase